MKRFAIMFIVLLVLPRLAWAEKKQRTAKILGSGSGQIIHSLEKVPCKVALEGILRDRGYRVLSNRDTARPKLLITITGACDHIPQMGLKNEPIKCTMDVKYRRGKKERAKRFVGKSRGSINSSWSDGCLQVRKWMKGQLGKAIDRDKLPNPHKWKTRKISATFRWKKGLSPMPLLKVSGFFKKAGYQAKMVKSGSTSCRFKLSLDQPPEQLEDLLRTYLGTKYRVSGGYAKGKLSFTLKAK